MREVTGVAQPARVRFKAEDIFDAPDDQYRYEVIDGKLYLTPAPDWGHQYGIMNLSGILWGWIRPRRLGFIVSAPLGVVLDDENGVQPDIVYVTRERANIISRRGLDGAPDLVVEALSPSTQARDRGIKMRCYAASGIPHYWLLDVQGEALEAYRLGPDGYLLVGTFARGSTFCPELFPGLEITLDEIWD